MFRLEDLTLFVRAAALNSFSDAAREVGVQPAQVSSAIKRTESTLAIRLFARSTRSLRLTPEGEVWLPYARQMLDVMHAGLQKFRPRKMKFQARCKSPYLPISVGTYCCRSFSRFDAAIPRCACGFFLRPGDGCL